MARTYSRILFEYENLPLAAPGACSRDKTYLLIRREAKHADGATGKVCSRKGILE